MATFVATSSSRVVMSWSAACRYAKSKGKQERFNLHGNDDDDGSSHSRTTCLPSLPPSLPPSHPTLHRQQNQQPPFKQESWRKSSSIIPSSSTSGMWNSLSQGGEGGREGGGRGHATRSSHTTHSCTSIFCFRKRTGPPSMPRPLTWGA